MGEQIEIRSQPVAVSREEARELVHRPEDFLTRLKHHLLAPTVEAAELGYKPFYAVEASLRKERIVGEEDTKRGAIYVDAVTGIARARPEGYADLETTAVSPADLISPELDEAAAVEEARSFAVKVERREKREADLGTEADLVYKPVWVVTLASGRNCVVDASTGEVFTEASLGELLSDRLRSLVGGTPALR